MTELEALRNYQSLSYSLNPPLWAGEVLSAELGEHASVLDSAISRYVSTEEIVVYRGTAWKLGALPKGTVITIPAFTSTTLHLGFTKQFMHSDCVPAALLEIHCPVGTPHAPLYRIEGFAADEAEILLGRKHRYIVQSTEVFTSRKDIVELVGPDPQNLHSEVWRVILDLVL